MRIEAGHREDGRFETREFLLSSLPNEPDRALVGNAMPYRQRLLRLRLDRKALR